MAHAATGATISFLFTAFCFFCHIVCMPCFFLLFAHTFLFAWQHKSDYASYLLFLSTGNPAYRAQHNRRQPSSRARGQSAGGGAVSATAAASGAGPVFHARYLHPAVPIIPAPVQTCSSLGHCSNTTRPALHRRCRWPSSSSSAFLIPVPTAQLEHASGPGGSVPHAATRQRCHDRGAGSRAISSAPYKPVRCGLTYHRGRVYGFSNPHKPLLFNPPATSLSQR